MILTKYCRRCGKEKQPPRDKSTAICVECQAETDCKHNNWQGGLRDDDWRCAADVHWFELVKPREGCLKRNPCFWHGDEEHVVTCPRFEPIGIEAARADDEAMLESLEDMYLIVAVAQRIKDEHAGESWQGHVACPKCQGRLSVTHSSVNGHVWGRCATDNCLMWME